MKISLSLIRSFIDLDASCQKIAETLTLLGIEVDAIFHETPPFSGIKAVEIVSLQKHPDSDKLNLLQISDGTHSFQVVSGAPNCRLGMKSAWAPPGSSIPGAGGASKVLEKTSIRGVFSEGMLVSEVELGLAGREDGILELPPNTPLGDDLTALLWDPVFDLSLTPNLGHCMSALGIARELSAAFNIPLKHQLLPVSKNSHQPLAQITHPKTTQRYVCRRIEQVKIGPSPFWLQRQLFQAGMKPISNAVDITNFILLKRGQPLHAFDADALEGPLCVDLTEDTTLFSGLDGINRELPPHTLVIKDTQKTVAIAGILGGANSAVSNTTTSILLEAACFDPTYLRKTSKQLNLRTESFQRFEKGVDPQGTLEALEEASLLIQELCQSNLLSDLTDIQSEATQKPPIVCRPQRVNQLLGIHLSQTEICSLLQRLQFQVHVKQEGAFEVHVPSFRSDVHEEVDLIEEVARLYGYNYLGQQSPSYQSTVIPHDPLYVFEKNVRIKASGLGLQEILTSDLISPNLSSLSPDWIQPHATLLKALHPKTEEYSILRTSLLPGMLQVVKHNLDRRNSSLHCFELGRIHWLQDHHLVELPMGALLLTGQSMPTQWSKKKEEVSFYDLKGLFESLFQSLSIPPCRFAPSTCLSFHPFRQCSLYIGDLKIGSMGELHPNVLRQLDIDQRVFFGEIDLLHLMNLQKKSLKMERIPTFPSSERDWTLNLALDQEISFLLDAIFLSRSPLLESVQLIDLYFPEQQDIKSATFRFVYRDPLKTISFDEVEKEHTQMVQNISKLLAKQPPSRIRS